jgi:signal transduction histidine kinase
VSQEMSQPKPPEQSQEKTKKPVRLLLIEDSADDAEVIKRVLTRSGFSLQVRWVDDGPTLSRALEEEAFDVAISDFRLPSFDALAALALVRASDPDLPFIVVSGQVGEDAAVDAVRRGANDYLLKQTLTRLPLAVERELREAEMRRDRTRVREQLVVSERMALIGTLASGLVHEINNPLGSLTVNLGYITEGLELARAAPPERADALLADLVEPIAQMKAACSMMGTIASDVRTFARSVNAATGEAVLHEVLSSAERVARFSFRGRARFAWELQSVPRVKGDPGCLAQVFLNLFLNAAHAIPEGDAQNNEIRAVLRPADKGRVLVEVRDTGVGMPPEVLSRIFDNFFSTKAGKGMGLGMAISRWIIESCGGEMQVESVQGRGTTFRIFFKAVGAQAAAGAGVGAGAGAGAAEPAGVSASVK